jgi:hypothetical protein
MIKTDLPDLVFASGDDWPIIPLAVVLDSDLVTPVNITGWTIQFSVFSPKNLTTPLFTMAVTLDTPASGTAHVPSVPAATSALCIVPAGTMVSHKWEAHRVDSGLRRELGFGSIPVRA